MSRKLQDEFFKNAKAAGYVARSAYKLLEMQQRHRIITPGMHILDLGCSPGAWLQVACQSLGPPHKKGCVIGVDLQETKLPLRHCDGRVQMLQRDAMQLTAADLRRAKASAGQCNTLDRFHVVLSDMCHSTLGVAAADVARSLQLARCAASIAIGQSALEGDEDLEEQGEVTKQGVLLPEGHLVAKLLQGEGSDKLAQDLRRHFRKVAYMQPKATRSESREIYLVALRRKPT